MTSTRIVKRIAVLAAAGISAAVVVQSLPPASDQGQGGTHGHQATVALNPQPLPPGLRRPGSGKATLASFAVPPVACQRLDPYKSSCIHGGWD